MMGCSRKPQLTHRRHRQIGSTTTLFILLMVLAAGCRSGGATADHRFQQMSDKFVAAQHQPANSFPVANPVDEQLVGPRSIDECIRLGLQQNPEIHEARFTVESLANRVPQAASLSDPMLEMMSGISHVQTAAGEQDFALSMNQKLPSRGKLATAAAIAEQDVIAARANLAAVELKVVEQIKSTYYQLYFLQQAIAIVEQDKQQLESIGQVVEQRFGVNRDVTLQDVREVQVAQLRLDTELSNYRQQKTSAQARLMRLLHVSPETPLEAINVATADQLDQDIHELYEIALQSRPELHAQLAMIQKDRGATCLAELQNRPDLTVGFNWIMTSDDGLSPVANGDDAFMLTVGMNLPVYGKRIDAGVREAQTRALANARKYDRLKDETMEGIADVFAKIKNNQENLELFRKDIVPTQKLTLEQSIENYQVGKTDFLRMIENWRQLLRFQIMETQLESELQMNMASLARMLGMFEIPAGFETE